jgi:hypothetical protein
VQAVSGLPLLSGRCGSRFKLAHRSGRGPVIDGSLRAMIGTAQADIPALSRA